MVEGRDVAARVGVPESLRGTSAYVGGAVTGAKAPARAAMCAGDDGGAPCEVAEKDGRLLSGSRFERHVRRSHNEVAPWNEIHDDGRIATGLAVVRGDDEGVATFVNRDEQVVHRSCLCGGLRPVPGDE